MDKKDLKILKVEISPEDKLKKALNKIKKECIKINPNCCGFETSQACETRFGGSAYSEKNDKAPICNNCGKPLTFVFQFREKYDKDLKPSGKLYSVYYCFDCVPIGCADEEKGQWAVVAHDNPENAKFIEQKENISSVLNPTSCTLSKIFILPDYESLENNHPEIAELCEEIDSDDPMSAYEDIGQEIGCEMEPCTTLGGYPIWIQGESSKVCPKCKKENMELVAQIDSEEAANLMFGDAGCLYVFRCPEHEDGFAIEMQCF